MKNFGLALCGIALDQTLQSNISANSIHTGNSKIVKGVNLGPRCIRLMKKKTRVKNLVTLSLKII
jgi:hypothetical protein